MEDPLPRIKNSILPVLGSLNLELYDLSYAGSGHRGILKVVIDKPGGVTLEDCEKASRNIGPVLEVYDFIDHAYVLEVSSPGLDRRLRNLEDYRQSLGKRVKVKLINSMTGQKILIGRLTFVEDNGTIQLLMDEKKKKTVSILYDNISEIHLEVEW